MKFQRNANSKVAVNKRNCKNCSYCHAEHKCPHSALKRTSIDRTKCNLCGACTTSCVGDVFSFHHGR